MKQYYIHYYRTFDNAYNLWYVDTDNATHINKLASMKNMERITRKQAEQKCAEENQRRKYDPGFSGYANSHIFPIDYDSDDDYINQTRKYKVDRYIIERVAV